MRMQTKQESLFHVPHSSTKGYRQPHRPSENTTISAVLRQPKIPNPHSLTGEVGQGSFKGGCRLVLCLLPKIQSAPEQAARKGPRAEPKGSLTMMRCTLPSSQSARTSCVYSGLSQSLARQHRRADPRSSTLAHLRLRRFRRVVDGGCWFGCRGVRCGVIRTVIHCCRVRRPVTRTRPGTSGCVPRCRDAFHARSVEAMFAEKEKNLSRLLGIDVEQHKGATNHNTVYAAPRETNSTGYEGRSPSSKLGKPRTKKREPRLTKLFLYRQFLRSIYICTYARPFHEPRARRNMSETATLETQRDSGG